MKSVAFWSGGLSDKCQIPYTFRRGVFLELIVSVSRTDSATVLIGNEVHPRVHSAILTYFRCNPNHTHNHISGRLLSFLVLGTTAFPFFSICVSPYLWKAGLRVSRCVYLHLLIALLYPTSVFKRNLMKCTSNCKSFWCPLQVCYYPYFSVHFVFISTTGVAFNIIMVVARLYYPANIISFMAHR